MGMVGTALKGHRLAGSKAIGAKMNKRVTWILIVLCGLIVGVLIFPGARNRFSATPTEGQSKALSATEALDLKPTPSTEPAPTSVAGSDSHAATDAQKSTPAYPTPRAVTDKMQAEARLGKAVETMAKLANARPIPRADWTADVLSFPPLLQQNASNNFVNSMERLAAAKTEHDRYLNLPQAAKSALIFGQLEDAQKYAAELLYLDAKFQDKPWRGGGAVHEGNFVLGRIAAAEGNLEEAKQYLLEAGKSTGSPVLGSFGPNMSLAKDLLKAGEFDAVLQYFKQCKTFWPRPELGAWAEDIREGRMPNFGSNLYY
jgi:hypothetical protein